MKVFFFLLLVCHTTGLWKLGFETYNGQNIIFKISDGSRTQIKVFTKKTFVEK